MKYLYGGVAIVAFVLAMLIMFEVIPPGSLAEIETVAWLGVATGNLALAYIFARKS